MNPGLRKKRQPSAGSLLANPSRELSYYLLFLLAANGRDEQAIEECLQILKRYPDDQIAHMWRETIRLRWHHSARRQVSVRKFTRNRRWHRLSHRTG